MNTRHIHILLSLLIAAAQLALIAVILIEVRHLPHETRTATAIVTALLLWLEAIYLMLRVAVQAGQTVAEERPRSLRTPESHREQTRRPVGQERQRGVCAPEPRREWSHDGAHDEHLGAPRDDRRAGGRAGPAPRS